MRPLSIRLVNFHSHVKSYINFRNRKHCLLLGEIDDRKDVSNGAGKSAFLDAMRFALFGITRAGNEKTIRDGQAYCAVTLVFRGNDGNKYRVHRSLKSNSKGKVSSELDFHFRKGNEWIRKEGEVKKAKSAVEAEIRAVVGMDAHVFNQSVYIGQNDIGAFANSLPTERKELLKRIIDLKKWDELEAIGRRKLNDRKKAYDTEKRVIDELEARVEDPHLLKIEIKKQDESLSALQKEKEELDKSRTGLTDRLKNVEVFDAIGQRLSQVTRERTSLIASIQRDSESVSMIAKQFREKKEGYLDLFRQEPEFQALLEKGQSTLREVEQAEKRLIVIRQEKRSLQEEVGKLTKTVEETRAQLSVIKKQAEDIAGLGNKCPTCSTEMDENKKHSLREGLKDMFRNTKALLEYPKRDLEAKSVLLAAKGEEETSLVAITYKKAIADREIVQAEAQLRAVVEGKEHLAKYEVSTRDILTKHKIEKETSQANVQTLTAEIATLESEIEKAKDDIQNMQRLRAELSVLNKSISEKDRLIVDGQGKRAALDARLLMANKLLKELSDKKAEQECSLRQINNLSTVTTMLGKKGIQAIILENSLSDLESYARVYLKRFTDDRYDLSLRTTVESKSSDNIRETLDIMIDKGNGVWHPYESFSGGEKMKVAFALRIALAQLVSHYSDVRPEYLYIDEVDGCLDVYARKLFMDMLAELSGEFDLILVVTHRPGLQEEFRDVITVKKTGDDSFLEDPGDVDPEDVEEIERMSFGPLNSFDLSSETMFAEV